MPSKAPTAYPGLQRVTDPGTQAALKAAYDVVHQLEARVQQLEQQAVLRETTIRAQNLRITGLADGDAFDDAVTVRQLLTQIDAVKKAAY